jgi:hypothetical protein
MEQQQNPGRGNQQVIQQLQSLKNSLRSDPQSAQAELEQLILQLQQEDQGQGQESGRKSNR